MPHEINYKLLDTIAINGRMSYMIYFKNKKKSRASGLEGVLYIDKNNFAVSKAIMRIKEFLTSVALMSLNIFLKKQFGSPSAKLLKS
jgi:hypothetical protein